MVVKLGVSKFIVQDSEAPTLLWWQTGIIYQIYPRSFKDSNGDRIGDLNGIIEKLDYLSGTLGVGTIWLSPFYPSPMADFGYNGAAYTGVDPIFGDLADFGRLVEEVHRRGLKIADASAVGCFAQYRSYRGKGDALDAGGRRLRRAKCCGGTDRPRLDAQFYPPVDSVVQAVRPSRPEVTRR